MNAANPPLHRKLRMALVGGAGQAFIGPIHHAAATLDQRAELIAGALSSDPERARQAGPRFGIAAERAYGTFRELIAAEAQRPADERIDFVSIATPNDTHFQIARAALEAGFHVVCDKPLTNDVDQAEQLAAMVEQTGAVFAVTHSYAAYPLVRQIRAMVLDGRLGKVQSVRVSYIQGGMHRYVPGRTPERAAWKMDASSAGPSGAMADIGTHAYHLLRYTTGLEPLEVACHLATFHPVRPLDDYGHAVLRCAGGELGLLTVSQVTHGRLNDLVLEVDGTEASLIWRLEESNVLTVRRHAQPVQVYEANRRADYLDDIARAACRLPGGHGEGFLAAFANLYGDFFDDLVRRAGGETVDPRQTRYPNVFDGLEGVRFVQACVASGRTGGWWQPI